MTSVLERRKELLELMRKLTLERGSFTINDIADETQFPRSTVQDWLTRLIGERCVVLKEEKRGRYPAKYIVTSTILSSACRRIFTTIDGDTVAIYHECMSGGCAAFCAYHHERAKGSIRTVSQDGNWLIELAELGEYETDIGFYPSSPVGVVGVHREGDTIVQRIRCIGGPAYSLTDMMMMAKGVRNVTLHKEGMIVEGEVVTQALDHLIIGIDDTDSEEGGATFALALGLLQYIGKLEGVIPIGHQVVMLNPFYRRRTAGNSCSYIECAVEPARFAQIRDIASRFVAEESLSEEWGVAIKRGFIIPEKLRDFGRSVRTDEVSIRTARTIADRFSIHLTGGCGMVGALAAIAYTGLSNEQLLNPQADLRGGAE
jgi:hypothetical protein